MRGGRAMLLCGIAALCLGYLIVKGSDPNVTGKRGESVFFSSVTFEVFCEWSFLGSQKTKEKDVIYTDGSCPDQVYGNYSGRVKESCNGSFLLMDLAFRDDGWYRLTCDTREPSYRYLHVVDPVCNISIARIPTVHGVLLYCNVTSNSASVIWTNEGKNVSEILLLSGNLTLNIPRGEDCGSYECGVQCGVLGQRNAGINLTFTDYASCISCPLVILILAVDCVYAIAFLVQSCFGVWNFLKKVKDVGSDDVEDMQNNSTPAVDTAMSWKAIFRKSVEMALKFWQVFIMFIGIVCFWDLPSLRYLKTIDLTFFSSLLIVTLVFEAAMLLVDKCCKKKVRQWKPYQIVFNVTGFAIGLMQHLVMISGAAHFINDCLKIRCLPIGTMCWGSAAAIVLCPYLLLLGVCIAAYTIKECRRRRYSTSNDKEKESKRTLMAPQKTPHEGGNDGGVGTEETGI